MGHGAYTSARVAPVLPVGGNMYVCVWTFKVDGLDNQLQGHTLQLCIHLRTSGCAGGVPLLKTTCVHMVAFFSCHRYSDNFDDFYIEHPLW